MASASAPGSPRGGGGGGPPQIEDQLWSNHPRNTPYLGSQNSANNNTGINTPGR